MIPVVEVIADSTSRIASVIFPAERATTMCTRGKLMQLRQGIIKPPAIRPGTSEDVDAGQVIYFPNNNITKIYQYFFDCLGRK